MISLSPYIPSDKTELLRLVALVSDPASAQVALDKLIQAKAEAELVRSDNLLLVEQSVKNQTDADSTLAEVARVRDELARTLVVRQTQLEDMSAQLGFRQSALDEREKNLESLTAGFNASNVVKVAEQNARNIRLAARESEVIQREAAAALLKQTYEARTEALLAVLSPRVFVLQAETGSVGNVMNGPG